MIVVITLLPGFRTGKAGGHHVTFAPVYPVHSLCHAFAQSGTYGNMGRVGGSCIGGCHYFYVFLGGFLLKIVENINRKCIKSR